MEENPAQWAIDLFEKNRNFERSVLRSHAAEIAMGLIGVCGTMTWNFVCRRPVLSGLQIHILSGSVGIILGRWLNDYSDNMYGRRDARLLDYIKLHPDRFPPPQNRKYADIFEPWLPVR